jgi:hypothetical protein
MRDGACERPSGRFMTSFNMSTHEFCVESKHTAMTLQVS